MSLTNIPLTILDETIYSEVIQSQKDLQTQNISKNLPVISSDIKTASTKGRYNSRSSDSGKSSSCSPVLLDCSFDSGIAGVLLDDNGMQLQKRIQQCQCILLALERDQEHFLTIRNRLSKITNRKQKHSNENEFFCNVCCTEIDANDEKTYVKCYICKKYICRNIKCADWLPKTAEWECELCQASKDSLAQTSSWVADQLTFNQEKIICPPRARSEVYIPISEYNDSLIHFESVSQTGINSNTITAEQKFKIREYVEEVVAKLLGGNLDKVAVNQLSKSENYLSDSKTKNVHNSTSQDSGSVKANGQDFSDISETRLRQMIQKIIAETMSLPPLTNGHAVSEVALNRPSRTLNNRALSQNDFNQRHRTEHYFEPAIYQDLLATAVLNKIVEKQLTNIQNTSERQSLTGDDLNGNLRHANSDQNFNAEKLSTSSGSSVEPRSDCSYPEEAQIFHNNDDKSSELLRNSDRDSVMSDYLANHMIPLPDLSTNPTESEDDDYTSVTSSAVGDGTWEKNWLFKKKKSPLNASVTSSSIGMLVPDPKEDVRAQIGDKTADEVSDLSELGSDSDDSLNSLRSQLEPINDRLINKHLIGGHNNKIILDELIERSSLISNTLPNENEPQYTDTCNEYVIDAKTKNEAINDNVQQQNTDDQKIESEMLKDLNSNSLTASDDISEFEGCTGFSAVEIFESSGAPSVVEILAAMALGPMLAVPSIDQPAPMTVSDFNAFAELKELALAEIKAHALQLTPSNLDVIPEESGDPISQTETALNSFSEEPDFGLQKDEKYYQPPLLKEIAEFQANTNATSSENITKTSVSIEQSSPNSSTDKDDEESNQTPAIELKNDEQSTQILATDETTLNEEIKIESKSQKESTKYISDILDTEKNTQNLQPKNEETPKEEINNQGASCTEELLKEAKQDEVILKDQNAKTKIELSTKHISDYENASEHFDISPKELSSETEIQIAVVFNTDSVISSNASTIATVNKKEQENTSSDITAQNQSLETQINLKPEANEAEAIIAEENETVSYEKNEKSAKTILGEQELQSTIEAGTDLNESPNSETISNEHNPIEITTDLEIQTKITATELADHSEYSNNIIDDQIKVEANPSKEISVNSISEDHTQERMESVTVSQIELVSNESESLKEERSSNKITKDLTEIADSKELETNTQSEQVLSKNSDSLINERCETSTGEVKPSEEISGVIQVDASKPQPNTELKIAEDISEEIDKSVAEERTLEKKEDDEASSGISNSIVKEEGKTVENQESQANLETEQLSENQNSVSDKHSVALDIEIGKATIDDLSGEISEEINSKNILNTQPLECHMEEQVRVPSDNINNNAPEALNNELESENNQNNLVKDQSLETQTKETDLERSENPKNETGQQSNKTLTSSEALLNEISEIVSTEQLQEPQEDESGKSSLGTSYETSDTFSTDQQLEPQRVEWEEGSLENSNNVAEKIAKTEEPANIQAEVDIEDQSVEIPNKQDDLVSDKHLDSSKNETEELLKADEPQKTEVILSKEIKEKNNEKIISEEQGLELKTVALEIGSSNTTKENITDEAITDQASAVQSPHSDTLNNNFKETEDQLKSQVVITFEDHLPETSSEPSELISENNADSQNVSIKESYEANPEEQSLRSKELDEAAKEHLDITTRETASNELVDSSAAPEEASKEQLLKSKAEIYEKGDLTYSNTMDKADEELSSTTKNSEEQRSNLYVENKCEQTETIFNEGSGSLITESDQPTKAEEHSSEETPKEIKNELISENQQLVLKTEVSEPVSLVIPDNTVETSKAELESKESQPVLQTVAICEDQLSINQSQETNLASDENLDSSLDVPIKDEINSTKEITGLASAEQILQSKVSFAANEETWKTETKSQKVVIHGEEISEKQTQIFELVSEKPLDSAKNATYESIRDEVNISEELSKDFAVINSEEPPKTQQKTETFETVVIQNLTDTNSIAKSGLKVEDEKLSTEITETVSKNLHLVLETENADTDTFIPDHSNASNEIIVDISKTEMESKEQDEKSNVDSITVEVSSDKITPAIKEISEIEDESKEKTTNLQTENTDKNQPEETPAKLNEASDKDLISPPDDTGINANPEISSSELVCAVISATLSEEQKLEPKFDDHESPFTACSENTDDSNEKSTLSTTDFEESPNLHCIEQQSQTQKTQPVLENITNEITETASEQPLEEIPDIPKDEISEEFVQTTTEVQALEPETEECETASIEKSGDDNAEEQSSSTTQTLKTEFVSETQSAPLNDTTENEQIEKVTAETISDLKTEEVEIASNVKETSEEDSKESLNMKANESCQAQHSDENTEEIALVSNELASNKAEQLKSSEEYSSEKLSQTSKELSKEPLNMQANLNFQKQFSKESAEACSLVSQEFAIKKVEDLISSEESTLQKLSTKINEIMLENSTPEKNTTESEGNVMEYANDLVKNTSNLEIDLKDSSETKEAISKSEEHLETADNINNKSLPENNSKVVTEMVPEDQQLITNTEESQPSSLGATEVICKQALPVQITQNAELVSEEHLESVQIKAIESTKEAIEPISESRPSGTKTEGSESASSGVTNELIEEPSKSDLKLKEEVQTNKKELLNFSNNATYEIIEPKVIASEEISKETTPEQKLMELKTEIIVIANDVASEISNNELDLNKHLENVNNKIPKIEVSLSVETAEIQNHIKTPKTDDVECNLVERKEPACETQLTETKLKEQPLSEAINVETIDATSLGEKIVSSITEVLDTMHDASKETAKAEEESKEEQQNLLEEAFSKTNNQESDIVSDRSYESTVDQTESKEISKQISETVTESKEEKSDMEAEIICKEQFTETCNLIDNELEKNKVKLPEEISKELIGTTSEKELLETRTAEHESTSDLDFSSSVASEIIEKATEDPSTKLGEKFLEEPEKCSTNDSNATNSVVEKVRESEINLENEPFKLLPEADLSINTTEDKLTKSELSLSEEITSQIAEAVSENPPLVTEPGELKSDAIEISSIIDKETSKTSAELKEEYLKIICDEQLSAVHIEQIKLVSDEASDLPINLNKITTTSSEGIPLESDETVLVKQALETKTTAPERVSLDSNNDNVKEASQTEAESIEEVQIKQTEFAEGSYCTKPKICLLANNLKETSEKVSDEQSLLPESECSESVYPDTINAANVKADLETENVQESEAEKYDVIEKEKLTLLDNAVASSEKTEEVPNEFDKTILDEVSSDEQIEEELVSKEKTEETITDAKKEQTNMIVADSMNQPELVSNEQIESSINVSDELLEGKNTELEEASNGLAETYLEKIQIDSKSAETAKDIAEQIELKTDESERAEAVSEIEPSTCKEQLSETELESNKNNDKLIKTNDDLEVSNDNAAAIFEEQYDDRNDVKPLKTEREQSVVSALLICGKQVSSEHDGDSNNNPDELIQHEERLSKEVAVTLSNEQSIDSKIEESKQIILNSKEDAAKETTKIEAQSEGEQLNLQPKTTCNQEFQELQSTQIVFRSAENSDSANELKEIQLKVEVNLAKADIIRQPLTFKSEESVKVFTEQLDTENGDLTVKIEADHEQNQLSSHDEQSSNKQHSEKQIEQSEVFADEHSGSSKQQINEEILDEQHKDTNSKRTEKDLLDTRENLINEASGAEVASQKEQKNLPVETSYKDSLNIAKAQSQEADIRPTNKDVEIISEEQQLDSRTEESKSLTIQHLHNVTKETSETENELVLDNSMSLSEVLKEVDEIALRDQSDETFTYSKREKEHTELELVSNSSYDTAEEETELSVPEETERTGIKEQHQEPKPDKSEIDFSDTINDKTNEIPDTKVEEKQLDLAANKICELQLPKTQAELVSEDANNESIKVEENSSNHDDLEPPRSITADKSRTVDEAKEQQSKISVEIICKQDTNVEPLLEVSLPEKPSYEIAEIISEEPPLESNTAEIEKSLIEHTENTNDVEETPTVGAEIVSEKPSSEIITQITDLVSAENSVTLNDVAGEQKNSEESASTQSVYPIIEINSDKHIQEIIIKQRELVSKEEQTPEELSNTITLESASTEQSVDQTGTIDVDPITETDSDKYISEIIIKQSELVSEDEQKSEELSNTIILEYSSTEQSVDQRAKIDSEKQIPEVEKQQNSLATEEYSVTVSDVAGEQQKPDDISNTVVGESTLAEQSVDQTGKQFSEIKTKQSGFTFEEHSVALNDVASQRHTPEEYTSTEHSVNAIDKKDSGKQLSEHSVALNDIARVLQKPQDISNTIITESALSEQLIDHTAKIDSEKQFSEIINHPSDLVSVASEQHKPEESLPTEQSVEPITDINSEKNVKEIITLQSELDEEQSVTLHPEETTSTAQYVDPITNIDFEEHIPEIKTQQSELVSEQHSVTLNDVAGEKQKPKELSNTIIAESESSEQSVGQNGKIDSEKQFSEIKSRQSDLASEGPNPEESKSTAHSVGPITEIHSEKQSPEIIIKQSELVSEEHSITLYAVTGEQQKSEELSNTIVAESELTEPSADHTAKINSEKQFSETKTEESDLASEKHSVTLNKVADEQQNPEESTAHSVEPITEIQSKKQSPGIIIQQSELVAGEQQKPEELSNTVIAKSESTEPSVDQIAKINSESDLTSKDHSVTLNEGVGEQQKSDEILITNRNQFTANGQLLVAELNSEKQISEIKIPQSDFVSEEHLLSQRNVSCVQQELEEKLSVNVAETLPADEIVIGQIAEGHEITASGTDAVKETSEIKEIGSIFDDNLDSSNKTIVEQQEAEIDLSETNSSRAITKEQPICLEAVQPKSAPAGTTTEAIETTLKIEEISKEQLNTKDQIIIEKEVKQSEVISDENENNLNYSSYTPPTTDVMSPNETLEELADAAIEEEGLRNKEHLKEPDSCSQVEQSNVPFETISEQQLSTTQTKEIEGVSVFPSDKTDKSLEMETLQDTSSVEKQDHIDKQLSEMLVEETEVQDEGSNEKSDSMQKIQPSEATETSSSKQISESNLNQFEAQSEYIKLVSENQSTVDYSANKGVLTSENAWSSPNISLEIETTLNLTDCDESKNSSSKSTADTAKTEDKSLVEQQEAASEIFLESSIAHDDVVVTPTQAKTPDTLSDSDNIEHATDANDCSLEIIEEQVSFEETPTATRQSTVVEIDNSSNRTDENSPSGNKKITKKLQRQRRVVDTTPSFEDISPSLMPQTSPPNTSSTLASLCQKYIHDKHLLIALENRRRRTLLMHRFLSTLDISPSVDESMEEAHKIHTEVHFTENPVAYESLTHSCDHSSDHDDCSDSFVLHINEPNKISFNFINNVLFSDQLSYDSNPCDRSRTSTVEEFYMENGNDERDILNLNSNNKSTTSTNSSLTKNINSSSETNSKANTNSTKNYNHKQPVTHLPPPSPSDQRHPVKSLTSAAQNKNLSLNKSNHFVFGDHLNNKNFERKLSEDGKNYNVIDLSDFIGDNDDKHEDDDDDIVAIYRHFVPGSIAEREYKKWYNAVEMPNNPYAPEALKRRISGSQERFIDLPNISPTKDRNPLDLLNEPTLNSDNNVKLENDYKRYSRDYYINSSLTTPQITPTKDPHAHTAKENREPAKITSSAEAESENVLYKAVPAQVIEESSSKLETMSPTPRQQAIPMSLSEDSDTVKLNDFGNQQHATSTKEIYEEEKASSSTFKKLENIGTVINPTRGSTPVAFKFLQPKRKLLEPNQVLTVDEEEPQITSSLTEKPVIEEEVAKALPSVKALARAFLMTTNTTQPQKLWLQKAKTLSHGGKRRATSPKRSLDKLSKTERYKPEDDVTITSDLSSLETDSSSMGAEFATTSNLSSSNDPPSPVPVRQGVLRNNIAFFENLKNK